MSRLHVPETWNTLTLEVKLILQAKKFWTSEISRHYSFVMMRNSHDVIENVRITGGRKV